MASRDGGRTRGRIGGQENSEEEEEEVTTPAPRERDWAAADWGRGAAAPLTTRAAGGASGRRWANSREELLARCPDLGRDYVDAREGSQHIVTHQGPLEFRQYVIRVGFGTSQANLRELIRTGYAVLEESSETPVTRVTVSQTANVVLSNRNHVRPGEQVTYSMFYGQDFSPFEPRMVQVLDPVEISSAEEVSGLDLDLTADQVAESFENAWFFTDSEVSVDHVVNHVIILRCCDPY